MDKLLIHAVTRAQIESFINRPVGTVLLVGPQGSGKSTLSYALVADLLQIEVDKLASHPYFLHIEKPEGKSEIPIDDIRELIRKLKLRVPAAPDKRVNRVVLIENAHYLSGEAQNALLKLLEEPPEASVFLLSAISEDSILPTVVSRAQRITILTPTIEDSLSFFSGHPKPQVEAGWRLSRGAAGLLASLLDESSHPLKNAVESAKRFLAQDSYQRLLTLKQIGSRENFGLFLDGLSRVLAALQAESIKKGARNQSRLLAARQLVDKSIAYHENNVNNRLISLMLATELTL